MRLVDTRWTRLGLPVLVAVIGILVGKGVSLSVSDYVTFLAVGAVTAAIAILGLGIVTGSAGMIALCQLTFAAVGAWVVAWLSVHEAPGGFLLWLLLGALAAAVVGVLIGLPALRLRGVNLAVVTLGFAAAADVTLVRIQFPGAVDGTPVTRPTIYTTDRSYLFFCVMVLAVCALAVYYLQRSRVGTSWRSVAFSERGTASAGQSVSIAKLTAFAVSAALGGVSGGLVAGSVQLPYASSFTPLQSLALYVLAIMAGAYLIDMAIFGGIMWVAVPEILKRLGVPQDWGFVIFGLLGVQALTSGSNLGLAIRGLVWRRQDAAQAARTAARRAEADDAALSAAPAPDAAPTELPVDDGDPVLVVEGLTVQFGALKALDGVSLSVPRGSIMGLIGPNGAGKSTFVDAISGFLPGHGGRVLLNGTDLAGASPARRARLGLRRTYQQDRVPPSLTVEAYVRFVAGRVGREQIEDALAHFGCPPASARLAAVDVGTRRLVEVVASLLAAPSLLVLDEPAAGLSHEEHVALAVRLREVPARYGVTLVIIEHDLDLVRSVCPRLTVLDFGTVLASGPQAEVLADPAVTRAYMGETELTS